MVLGIRLEIDKGSVKQASKEITQAAEKSIARKEKSKQIATEEKRIRKEKGIEEPGDEKKKGGAFGGAALGGFIGAIISQLKPIQELLGVIAGVLQIFMVPVLILLKPFLILFLKVGIALLKAFSPSAEGDAPNKTPRLILIIGGILAAIIAAIAGAPALLIAAIAIAFVFLVDQIFKLGFWLGSKSRQAFEWLLENAIKPAFEWVANAIKAVGDFFIKAWDWIKKIANTVWNWFMQGFERVKQFGKMIWELFVGGLKTIKNLGTMIWDLFKQGLSSIADLGSRIWNWIKSSLGSIFGGRSKSVDDALITSSGQVINLNQNDNVLAFQDFSQIENMANAGGGRSGGNINITVHGFVGDEDTLADRIAKSLNKSSRGSSINFN